MTRVRRGYVAVRRRKKLLGHTKGYREAHSTLIGTANQQIMKALLYSYKDRRNQKRKFRNLWIRRINAESRSYGISYSKLIHKLKTSNILLNRKVLSQLCIFEPLLLQQIFYGFRKNKK